MGLRLSDGLQDDINFVRYMAENFASFDYKTQEEVLTVLKYLTSILSTTGSQLVESFSPSHLLTQLHEPLGTAGPGVAKSANGQQEPVHALPPIQGVFLFSSSFEP